MGDGHVFDDRETEPGAAGGRDLAASTRKNRSKMRSCALSGMPMPWSLTLTSTVSPAGLALITTRVCSGL